MPSRPTAGLSAALVCGLLVLPATGCADDATPPQRTSAKVSVAELKITPTKVTRRTATFRLSALRGRGVSRARLARTGRRAITVRVSSVRRAVLAKRTLKVTLPKSWRGAKRRSLSLRLRVITSPRTNASAPTGSGPCQVPITSFGGAARPPACWRPYNDASPFNQALPSSPRLAPNSAAIVKRIAGFGPVQHLLAGNSGTSQDYGRPMYFSRASDPVFTVRCNNPEWGRCSIEGAEVRIPDAARIPGGDDHHLTVVDTTTGDEWDFWDVRSKPRGGGVLQIGWGGRTRIDGDGLGSDAVAARTATMAGTLRAEELASGRIDHALAISIRCDNGQFVFPAAKSAYSCAQAGLPMGDAPPLGTRLQLAMSASEIDQLDVPGYTKTILHAAAEYGMFMVDTGGTLGIVTESGLASTSFGAPDPWTAFARPAGAIYSADTSHYVMNVRDGVDWAGRLRVVDPCVTKRSC